jgi:hypothetical protein
MQRINRILAFASVSFVLIFIAKINKVGLHTAYFKTLAESEFRNSQDLASQDLVLIQDISFDIEEKVDLGGLGGSQIVTPSSESLHFVPQEIASHYQSDAIFVSTLHFIRAVAPRAPTA